MPYSISSECVGCGACARKCPEKAISGEIKVRFDIDDSRCRECGVCFDICPRGAVLDPRGNPSPKRGKKRKAVTAKITTDSCAGCRNCFLNCPQDAISVIKKGLFSIACCRVDPEKCVGCGTCAENCITGAVELG